MKKLITLVIILALCVGLAIPASAEGTKPQVSVADVNDELEISKEKIVFYEDPSKTGRHSIYFDGAIYDYEIGTVNFMKTDNGLKITNKGGEGYLTVKFLFFFNNGSGEYFMGARRYVNYSNKPYYRAYFYYLDDRRIDNITTTGDTPYRIYAGDSVTISIADIMAIAAGIGTDDCYFSLILDYTSPEGELETYYKEYFFRANDADFARLSGGAADVPEIPFTDVSGSDYYYDAVKWAYENGVTTGTSDTTFSPADTCTRGQVVTFLWRASGCPEPTGADNPFADVAETDYFYKPVLWAVENGITNGTSDTTFSPHATCTNAHVVTFLWRAKGCPAAQTEGTEYYSAAVAWAEEFNLLRGIATAFDPRNDCPRADIVTFIYRAA